eukprot:scaffold36430_cov13-Prasinocladus_malaysianus.AAC.1
MVTYEKDNDACWRCFYSVANIYGNNMTNNRAMKERGAYPRLAVICQIHTVVSASVWRSGWKSFQYVY